ncbi:washout [Carabus blaptoides fortunei]
MHIYEVPVIPNNLRREETVVQIADVLQHLCNVFDDIIVKVNSRIDDNVQHMSLLTSRINVSTEKIAKLRETKKAIQIFSSSKYPATDIHKRYKTMFIKSDVTLERTDMKFKDLVSSNQPLEKLQFYHVKGTGKLANKSKYGDVEEGLGSFPNNVESVNELFLFNTSKNPYKNYVMSDPLQVTLETKDEDGSKVLGPDAAPLSISQRSALNRSFRENYFYSPGLGDVPSIDVPLDLPDLPGVADDLRYLMETDPGIAPSVTTTPTVPELPSIVQTPSEVPFHATETLPVVTLPESLQLPLPPVPNMPSVEPEHSIETVVVEVDPVPTVTQRAVPVEKKPPRNELPVVEDMRASLMAAIRQAGGLKKANLRNTEPKKEVKSGAEGNNLMADLNAKLALRRKGISGTKANDGSEMNTALSRVSAMIPPPPLVINEPNESTNTEDEWAE